MSDKMKPTITHIVAVLAVVVLFIALVYLTLAAANVALPAANTVYGPTTRRIWAAAVMALAGVGVVIGGFAQRRAAGQMGGSGNRAAGIALAIGLIAMVNGVLNLAMATGGPGSGNGVVGAAVAIVLGLIATALGGLALGRRRAN